MNRLLWMLVLAAGLLVIFMGLAGTALPYAQADVLVPLVRETPGNEAYILVARYLSKWLVVYYSILIVLGVVIVVAASIGIRKSNVR